MASVQLDPAYRRISVDEFLEMDFGGARAELEDGLIYMMAGGNEAHARIAANILIALGPKLRGSGCRPYGSDFAAQTAKRTIRFPDVSVHCDNPAAPGNEGKRLLGDPRVVFEVLSRSTASHDQRTKLAEYRALAGLREIVFVDPRDETIRLVRRSADGEWTDEPLASGADLPLASLGVTVSHAEIFARD